MDRQVDILIVGSGGGALTAAVVAADRGADVLVIEKGDRFGGTTATSGGVLWIPNSHRVAAAGQEDNDEDAIRYIRSLAGDVAPERIRAFVEAAPRMLRYLEERAGLRYDAIPYTDYHAEQPGGRLGYRSHEPHPLDGRLLGDALERMWPTHQSAMLFGKITWTASEAAPLISRSKGWQRSLARVLWRYYSDVRQRVRSPRSRFLTSGNALIGRLWLALEARGVPLELNTALKDLIVENGRVVGAEVVSGGKAGIIRAARGVILAAGGYERNGRLRGEHLTASPDAGWSGGQPYNEGDALVAATRIGAATERMDAAWWAPSVSVPGEDRARPLFFERGLPGAIIVNQAGERYTNEAASYHIVGSQMIACDRPGAGTAPSWVLFDQVFRARYPMGPVMPLPDAFLSKEVRSILHKADSIDDLAQQIGVPPARLIATVERFNRFARNGKDEDFGRGDNPYDRYYGDPKAGLNPNLAPLAKPPFYALRVDPGDIGTSGGLVTDVNGAVLDTSGRPLPGLYAIGNTSSSVMGRAYPGAGATIAPAMTFGMLAAEHATGRNNLA
ncbi:FAD-dependent oxidoreductase [Sphingomonas jatrophae]|nr:FAD-dependent oxidoreductase [Sphingomonas jatrophae]